jgi:uncharacterized membrane protein YagU involved in acid resistance
MSKEKRIEQEIGWLKVAFAILFATDISLIAWLAQNYSKIEIFFVWTGAIIGVIISLIVFFINKKVYNQLNEMEEL